MPRWEPDAVGRLQEAAFALFSEQGFERTTIVQIAQRAGLTERTFFNHFADKREVLFGPIADAQRVAVVSGIADSPSAFPVLGAVVFGLQTAADQVFEPRRDVVIRRRHLVEATPELRERELRKHAALTEAIADALCARGTDLATAQLAARAGMAIHQSAMQQWAEPSESRPLRELLAEAQASLCRIAAL
ncbi:TetR/AcrR family transcriptional regulator [Gryllotalpicola ginsengisoli]|uniref:TetR/AcrR family transcriptional regulator n=1 Tax=Gryllotalpicola ginsengisoli TaxID=444608 RepID=UPI0003B5AD1C|nr:TetR/AcrR family transcriptional regulator [Gryllotalpicola ginsengisoli]